jgi:hypothetical protein
MGWLVTSQLINKLNTRVHQRCNGCEKLEYVWLPVSRSEEEKKEEEEEEKEKEGEKEYFVINFCADFYNSSLSVMTFRFCTVDAFVFMNVQRNGSKLIYRYVYGSSIHKISYALLE